MAATRNLWPAVALSIGALGSWHALPAAQSASRVVVVEPPPTFVLDSA